MCNTSETEEGQQFVSLAVFNVSVVGSGLWFLRMWDITGV